MRRAGAVALLAASALVGTGVAAAARHPRPGTPNRSFGRSGIATLAGGTRLFGVTVQGDGKVVAVGESGASGRARVLVARFLPSGRLDHSFGRRGIVSGPLVRTGHDTGSIARAVAIGPHGTIVVVGKATDSSGVARDGLLVERYRSSGRLDRSFGSGGVVKLLGSSFADGYGVAVRPNGAIVATGTDDTAGSGGVSPRVVIAELRSNGSPERSFGSHGVAVVDVGAYSYGRAVALERGGTIVVAGSRAPGLQVTSAFVARVSSSGRLAGYYSQQYARSAAYSSFNAIAIHGSSIIAAGSATDGQSQADAIVARFSASGAPDRSFGSGGVAYARSATLYTVSSATVPGANAVAVTPRGALLAAGETSNSGATGFSLWEFTAGGGLRSSFGAHGVATLHLPSGTNGEAAALALGRGGTAIAAGDTNVLGQPFRGIVAGYAS
jgi:uncharacterized delta-60 repeat protein